MVGSVLQERCQCGVRGRVMSVEWSDTSSSYRPSPRATALLHHAQKISPRLFPQRSIVSYKQFFLRLFHILNVVSAFGKSSLGIYKCFSFEKSIKI